MITRVKRVNYEHVVKVDCGHKKKYFHVVDIKGKSIIKGEIKENNNIKSEQFIGV